MGAQITSCDVMFSPLTKAFEQTPPSQTTTGVPAGRFCDRCRPLPSFLWLSITSYFLIGRDSGSPWHFYSHCVLWRVEILGVWGVYPLFSWLSFVQRRRRWRPFYEFGLPGEILRFIVIVLPTNHIICGDLYILECTSQRGGHVSGEFRYLYLIISVAHI